MSMRTYRWLTVAAALLLVVAAADGLYKGFGESKQLFRVVVGGEAPVSGDLYIPSGEKGVRLHAEASGQVGQALSRYVDYKPKSPDFDLRFIELKGRLWRATLYAPLGAKPGEASLQVYFRGYDPGPESKRYTVRIYPDQAALNADLTSYLERYLGLQPWWLVVGLIPVILALFWVVYRQTTQEEAQLIGMGIGPIYKLAKRGADWEVVFGLGRVHGVRAGDELAILDARYNRVGTLVVDQAEEDFSAAALPMGSDIKPGYFVVRSDAAAAVAASVKTA
ncbi:MAG: hypothetical protein H0S85_06615 [Desulfovibrionaceae bacterium]|jgi:hypothetical protein|nr:hypothetical protein [Desulfovibrionaceae bacterium]